MTHKILYPKNAINYLIFKIKYSRIVFLQLILHRECSQDIIDLCTYSSTNCYTHSLRENYSNTAFFVVRIFPVFGLDMEFYRVNLRIQSENRKIRTRKNSVSGQFSRSDSNLG